MIKNIINKAHEITVGDIIKVEQLFETVIEINPDSQDIAVRFPGSLDWYIMDRNQEVEIR